jgi:hypothetical protein
VYYYSNGDIYSGGFRAGKKHGSGQMYFKVRQLLRGAPQCAWQRYAWQPDSMSLQYGALMLRPANHHHHDAVAHSCGYSETKKHRVVAVVSG